MCPRRIHQLMTEIESGRLKRYCNSEGLSLCVAAEPRQSAEEPPRYAEPSLHCPLTHGSEPEWFYDCDRNDIS